MPLLPSLGQLHCAPSPEIPTPPPRAAGVDTRGSCDQSRTVPLHSSFLLTIPLLWHGLSPMGCSPSGKQKCFSMASPQASSRSSPPASVWISPSIPCLLPSSPRFVPLQISLEQSSFVQYWVQYSSDMGLWIWDVILSWIFWFFFFLNQNLKLLSSNMRCIILYVSVNTVKPSWIKH